MGKTPSNPYRSRVLLREKKGDKRGVINISRYQQGVDKLCPQILKKNPQKIPKIITVIS